MKKAERQEILDVLNEAKDALASSYQVCDWPANGRSTQDYALTRVKEAIAKFSLDEKTKT